MVGVSTPTPDVVQVVLNPAPVGREEHKARKVPGVQEQGWGWTRGSPP